MQLRASLALGVLAALAAAPALAAPSGHGFGLQLAALKDGGAHAPNGQGHGFGLMLVKGERDDDSRDAMASAVSEAVAAPAEAIAALFSSSAGNHAGKHATGAVDVANVHAALGAAVDGLPPVSAAPTGAMPEPTGALLFGVGSGIVALRLRRRCGKT